MANRKLNFISNNVKGLQNSTKRIKIFEYLKNKVTSTVLFFYKKLIQIKTAKKAGPTNLKDNFFSHMEKRIPAV